MLIREFSATVVGLVRQVRVDYLPLMVYAAAGISGLTISYLCVPRLPDGLRMISANRGVRGHQGAGVQNCSGDQGAVVPVESEVLYPSGDIGREDLDAVDLLQSVGELPDGQGHGEFTLADCDADFPRGKGKART